MAAALPPHRVPPGLLMVMPHDEVEALARWNAELAAVPDSGLAPAMAAVVFGAETLGDVVTWRHTMAVEQWRFNVAQREAAMDAGGVPMPGGGFLIFGADDLEESRRWHFPVVRRGCPDGGTCHHECGPLAGCWRVNHCGPLSMHGETWTRAERIANERPGGRL